MQVITKLDRLFIWIYSVILLLVGVVGAFAAKRVMFLLLILFVVEPVYLYFALRVPLKRYRAVKKPFPGEWRDFLLMDSIFYRNLTPEGRLRFEFDVLMFLSQYSISRTRGGDVEPDIRLRIAAGIVTVMHGHPSWDPPIHDGVVLFPGDRFNKNYQSGRGLYGGMATKNGPLILTEGALEESYIHPHDGNNVIYHEMAHYFDFEDGRAEGIPSIRMAPQHLEPWRQLINAEWQKVREGRSFMRPYAGENEAECFAVATEYFFECPWVMHAHSPQLYEALKMFYNLDTLQIITPERI